MLINNCIDLSQVVQVNMRLVEKTILNMQKDIYKAVKVYDIKEKYKWQKKILLRRETVLSVLYNIMKVIKKKFLYLIYIIKNF